MSNIVTLSEAQRSLYGENPDAVLEQWEPHISAIRESFSYQGKEKDPVTEMMVARCLTNLKGWFDSLDEATKAVNVGAFIHHGFELVTAVMPNLISNELFTVQPMSRRVGEVFYMSLDYGKNKGNAGPDRANTTMFGNSAAGNLLDQYTLEKVTEEIIGTGTGASITVNTTVTCAPLKDTIDTIILTWTSGGTTRSVANTAAGTTVNLAAGGNGTYLGTSTINTVSGAVSVTFQSGYYPDLNTPVLLTYDISFEDYPEHAGEIDINIVSQAVTAQNRRLKVRYSLDASFDLQQAFNRSLDTEAKSAAAMEIRQELDTYNISKAYNSAITAGAGNVSWSKTPLTGVSYYEHKWTFIDQAVIPAANKQYDATRRVTANYMVCGNEVANIVESMAPRFKRLGRTVPGPHFIGELDGIKVYRAPSLPPKKALLGYKGNLFLDAALVYAPYMPIFTTRTAMLDDMVGRFGVASSDAHFIVNPLYFSTITITE